VYLCLRDPYAFEEYSGGILTAISLVSNFMGRMGLYG